ncbi:hypothetical protein AAFF_G00104240 [Aldrovandia affinis]|uniref:Uncharacterized protein n=1 Tax=Aldrovandia affinis TaxID=143900 RepID=A0AAD7WXI3_9TELE|nr:hypothetical protein AAFF_G00104240 [Aldrovandia affinis]
MAHDIISRGDAGPEEGVVIGSSCLGPMKHNHPTVDLPRNNGKYSAQLHTLKSWHLNSFCDRLFFSFTTLICGFQKAPLVHMHIRRLAAVCPPLYKNRGPVPTAVRQLYPLCPLLYANSGLVPVAL